VLRPPGHLRLAGAAGWLARGLAVAALAGLAGAAGWSAPLERDARDALVRLAARHAPPAPPAGAGADTPAPDVAVVAIDPLSLRAHPEWPWSRRVHARTVRALREAGARAVAFDVDFSSARDPEADRLFAREIEAHGRVVLAAFRQIQRVAGGAELEVASLPIPQLADAAAGVGSVLVPVDPDGAVRRAPRASRIAGSWRPALAAAALAAAVGEPVEAVAPADGGVAGRAVDYRRARPPYPVIPVAEVLAGRFDAESVAGRVVFVGATAAELQDLWTTPLAPAVPGVQIQAALYRTLAAERAGLPVLRPMPATLAAVWLVLLSLGAAPLAALPPGRRVLAAGAGAAAAAAAAVACVVGPGWLPAPAAWGGVLLAHWVLGLEVVRRRVEGVLARQQSSLSALEAVGAAVTGRVTRGAGPLEQALALLADGVGARGVALWRCDDDGALDGRRLEWRPAAPAGARASEPVGRPERAERALDEPGLLPWPGSAAEPPEVYAALRADDRRVGVLVVECAPGAELDDTQLRTIAAVGAQVGLSARNLSLLEDLRRTFATSIAALAGAVEARDGYTELHCRRLAAFSRLVAERMGLPADEVEGIELGALLHDVGKIGIRDEVLLKPGRFTAEERRAMQEHAEIGERIAAPIHGLSETALACIRSHHEWWDGSGYPDGLAGEGIPLPARIVSVVDVWDALSTARPYKPALPQERVLGILEKGRGAQFDPEVLDCFLRVLDEQGEEMLALVERDAAREGAR